MTKKKARLVVFFAICAVLVTLILIFGKSIFDNLRLQYLYSSYPQKYSEEIERLANEYKLDKNLVYAVVKTESGFNEKAESNVGARGLMQIMEVTFDTVKSWSDDDGAVFDDMFIAEKNLQYGCFLLGYLMRYYDGNEMLAICAYHAGTGNVDVWLSNEEYSSDGKTLDHIPVAATAHYLEKITNAKQKYITLYSTED